MWGPEKCNTVGGVVRIQWCLLKEGLDVVRKNKLVIIKVWSVRLCFTAVGDWVDQGIIVERRKLRVFSFDETNRDMVIRNDRYILRETVVQVREGNSILSSDCLTDNNLIDVVELIPIFITKTQISVQWLKLRATGDSHVQGLGGVERFEFEEVEVVLVCEI
jgi:hypothetical protein